MTERGVVIVGGSSEIGRAIARRFAAYGDRIVGISLTPCDDESAFAESLVMDCSTQRGAADAIDSSREILGGLDVLVCAAALMPVAPAHETSDEDWRSAFAATLDTAFFTCRETLKILDVGGAIVAVSSVNATLAAPGVPAYAAAKGGLEALVRQLALEYGPRGIRVNGVAPGLITSRYIEGASEGYPLGRAGTPEEVASAVAFLASREASFITGTILPVDGGLSIASPAAFLRPDLRSRFL